MYKRHNAFTLIELLAVIIILAIVALIATPIILNVIEDAKISAGKSEAQMILGGINNYCETIKLKKQMGTLGENDVDCEGKTTFTTPELEKMVNLGNATVESNTYNNKVTSLVVISNNHKFTLCSSGQFAMDDESCPRDPNSLITKLLAQYSKDNTTGLLKDSTNPNLYYYKGTNEQVSNNFLWYGGHQWRVLEFDTSANTLTLITQQPLTTIQPASAVWESEEAYNNSYINTWLNEYFWNSLDSSIQGTIQNSTFNIGIYTDVDEITTTKKVGLLDEDQYKRSGDGTTGQNSFLNIKDYFWLGNRESSSRFRYVDDVGNLLSNSVSVESGVRAVIKISDITITGGDGTLASNYQVANKSTNTDNVQVGEYINVPYSGSDNACGSDNMCAFRVVSKDEDSIKVVLNGLLPTESEYGSSVTITTSHTIYTPLNTFANGISNTYRYTENKTFYIGDYPYNYPNGANYEDVQDEILEASIGLPTVGEMFSGNDIDMGSTKTFVDVNTIENPTASSLYWTMNRSSSSDVRFVYHSGYLFSNSVSVASGVRAVIYLKSGTSAITFTGGEGTPNSPYQFQ